MRFAIAPIVDARHGITTEYANGRICTKVTGPRIVEKPKDEKPKVPVQRVYLLRTSEDDIEILHGARVIGKLVWEKKKQRHDDL